MSTSVLQTKYVFGYHTGVAQNCAFISDTVVAYAAGYQIVLNDTQDGTQKFINSFVPVGGEPLDGFTCIALSPNRKLLAVAERGDKPEINIFDSSSRRKKKNLIHAEAIAKCSILSMEFTHGNENLVVLSGHPDSTIVVFRWQKGKKLYDYKLYDNVTVPLTNSDQFTQLSLNPLDSETTVVLGPSFLHFYRLTDDRVMPIPTSTDQIMNTSKDDEDDSIITCMCWIQDPADGVVVANNQGKIALFESGEFQAYLNIVLPIGVGVTAITCLSSGLVCGCSDGGLRFLKVKPSELGEKILPANLFELTHSWHHAGFNQMDNLPTNHGHGGHEQPHNNSSNHLLNGTNTTISGGNNGKLSSSISMTSLDSITSAIKPSQAIKHIAISRDEDRLCCGYEHGQLYYVHIIGTPEGVKGEDMRPVATQNHNPGVLTGLDVCVRKPLAVTSCLDRTVRVWNYVEGKLELTKTFGEDPLSVAFHPSGLHVAVGFGDKLRLLHLLMEDMRCFKELPVKASRECRFSRGGHYLAATGQNNVILVFEFFTGEKLAELRGHSGRIRCLSWGPDDATLVSCGNDGALYCWDWEGGKRIGESVTKGIQYSVAITATSSAACNGSVPGERPTTTAGNAVAGGGPGGSSGGGPGVGPGGVPAIAQGGAGGGGGPQGAVTNQSGPGPQPGGGQAVGSVAGSGTAGVSGGPGGGGGGANSTLGGGGMNQQNSNVYEASKSIYTCTSEGVLRELDIPELQMVKVEDTGVLLSQVVLSSSETMLFAGTGEGPGMVRAYSFPVSQEFVEFSCCSKPISKMRLTFNDATLLVADETGGLVVFDVKGERDKKGKSGNRGGGASGGGGGSRGGPMPSGMIGTIPWSEDVLITRSDLADREGFLSELVASVEELLVQNDYQLRLREMTQAEDIKEVTEKFKQDLEAERNKYELLKEEKHDLGIEYEERLRQVQDVHLNELEELENNYQSAIMNEVDEYQKLIIERNTQSDSWDDLRNTLIQTHQRRVNEMKEDFEQRLEEDRQLKEQLDAEKAESAKEFKEMKSQLEDDVDTEIENIRERYDTRLSTERDLTLRFKGENGIMRKKFAVLAKTKAEQEQEITAAKDKELEIREMIRDVENDVKRLKREIRGREDIISEREKRIYDLKKKNQELDKFKYVLDFKIKELKHEIEPRETEIVSLKDQIKAMDYELEKYHHSNANMDILIGDLRNKLDGMQSVASNIRSLVHRANASVRIFKADLEQCVQHVQDPNKLIHACQLLIEKHGVNKNNNNNNGKGVDDKDLDENVLIEYEQQRIFLEKTLSALNNKFISDVGAARIANAEVMRNNMSLIRDITAAREANKAAKITIQSRGITLQRMRMTQKQTYLKMNGNNGNYDGDNGGGGGSVNSGSLNHGGNNNGGGWTSGGGGSSICGDMASGSDGGGKRRSGGGGGRNGEEAAAIEMAANRDRIAQMRDVVSALEKKLELERGHGNGSRPNSRGDKLPPVVPTILPVPSPVPQSFIDLGSSDHQTYDETRPIMSAGQVNRDFV